MAIIGVLASALVGIINPVKQLQRTKDSQRKADMKQMQTALELYRADNGEYPADDEMNAACATSSLVEGGVTYMSKIPCKPGGGNYSYTLVTSNSYTIGVCMEVEDTSYENGHDCEDDKYFEVKSP